MKIKHLRVGAAAAVLAVVAVLAVLAVVASRWSDGGDGDGAPPEPSVTEAAPAEEPDETTPTDLDEAPTTAPTTTTTTAAPTTALPQSPPHRVELPSGVFVLADRIAQKLTLDHTLNLVLSVIASGDQGSGPAMGAGFSAGAAETSERHSAGIEARLVSADSGGAATQAEQIDDLVLSGVVDCLVVEADNSDVSGSAALARATDRAVNAGVPVFTVGDDSPDSRRLAFYGLDDFSVGRLAGETVGRWSLDERILLRQAGVLTGDASDPALRLRMEGFIAGITAELPDLTFVNGPNTVESHGFDPDELYEESGEWILTHPDVDIIFHTDHGGLEAASAFIADQALYGDVSIVGLATGGLSQSLYNYVYEGVVVAAMVPGLANQAAAAAAACGDFLLAGAYNNGAVAVDPVAVTEDNLDERDWTLPENR